MPTTPTDEATAAERERDAVLGALLTQAVEIIERAGEIAPFAARLRSQATEPELVAPVADDEYPRSQALIDELITALRIDAEGGGLRACGIAADVVVTLPDGATSDAIRVNVEHLEARPLAAYLPYRHDAAHLHLDDLITTPGDPLVFAATPGA